MVLSQYVELSYADDLLADGRGGIGYLLKDRVSDVEDFLAACDLVAAGGTVDRPAGGLAARRPGAATRSPALTPREAEVLGLMAEGRSNAGIAQAMTVTEGAVEKYTARVFAKLDLHVDDGDHRRVLAVLAWLRRA